MEYFYCKGYYFDDEFILYKECSKWLDDVETTSENHWNKLEPVVSCKRWKMKQKKDQNQENNYVYINVHWRRDGEFQHKHD